MQDLNHLIDKLEAGRLLEKKSLSYFWIIYLTLLKYASGKARKTAHQQFGNKIYIRGLIEVSNYCVNDCYYCGIRKSTGLPFVTG